MIFNMKLSSLSAGLDNTFGVYRGFAGRWHAGMDLTGLTFKKASSKKEGHAFIQMRDTSGSLTSFTFDIVDYYDQEFLTHQVKVLHARPESREKERMWLRGAIPDVTKWRTVKESATAIKNKQWTDHHVHLEQWMNVPMGVDGETEMVPVFPGWSWRRLDPSRFMMFILHVYGNNGLSKFMKYCQFLMDIEQIGIDPADKVHRTYGFATQLWQRAKKALQMDDIHVVLALLEWWYGRLVRTSTTDQRRIRQLDVIFQGSRSGKIRAYRNAELKRRGL